MNLGNDQANEAYEEGVRDAIVGEYVGTVPVIRQEIRVAPLAKSFGEMLQVAEVLLKSGFLPRSIRTAEQAVAIIIKGHEVGLPEMQALSSIHIIEGKPTMSAELMLALARARGGVNAEVIESTDERCRIRFTRAGATEHVESFSVQEAQSLGFVNKENYKRQLATMLRWRCITKGLRFYAPEAIAGISYTPDEINPSLPVDESGAPLNG